MKRKRYTLRKIDGVNYVGDKLFACVCDGHHALRTTGRTGSNIHRHLLSRKCTNTASRSVTKSIREGIKDMARDVPQQAKFEERLMASVMYDNLPFQLLESESFRELLLYGRRDMVLPSRRKLVNCIEDEYEVMYNKLKKILAGATSRISITFDLWTDIQTRYHIVGGLFVLHFSFTFVVFKRVHRRYWPLL